MDRPSTANPATARDVILEIVRNMKEGLEPLHYSTLPPAIYHVYLHPDDMERLRGIVPRIVDEARRALDAEVESLNRASLVERLKLARRGEPKISAPEGGWQIRVLENTDEEVAQGDIVIYSELALPAKMELSAGSMTKRICHAQAGAARRPRPDVRATKKPGTVRAGAHRRGGRVRGDRVRGSGRAEDVPYDQERDCGGPRRARLLDRHQAGYAGRCVAGTFPAAPRRGQTGQFFLKDLSRLGTTINGEAAPSSIDFSDGEKRDRHVEAPVPAQARIGLAGVVFLEFRSTARG